MVQNTDPRVRRRRILRVIAVVMTGLLAVSLATANSSGAVADTVLPQHVYNTGGEGLYLHPAAPGLNTATSELMPDTTEFDVDCFSVSDNVLGDVVWDHGTDATTGATGWVADYYVDTPVQMGQEVDQLTSLGLFACGSSTQSDTSPGSTVDNSYSGSTTVSYDRNAAAQWAQDNANASPHFSDDDCTFFASRALWAGGLPRSPIWTDTAFIDKSQPRLNSYPVPSPSRNAAQANALVQYLVYGTGMASMTPIDWSDNTAGGAQLGDLIAFDWNAPGPDGSIDHIAIVTGFNADGYPLVSQHSPGRLNKYWSWDPGLNGSPSGWIQYTQAHNGNEPRAYLIHINS